MSQKALFVNFKRLDANIIHRTDTLMMYYDEVKKHPILSIEEEQKLFEQLKSSNKTVSNAAREKIINCNLRFVIAVAKKYANGDNLLDVINEGNIGLIEALNTYSNDKGTKFSTWAVWYIRKHIMAYINGNTHLVKNIVMPKIKAFIKRYKSDFIKKEDREPTNDEIANMIEEKLGLSVHPSDVSDSTYTYIDKPISSDGDSNMDSVSNLSFLSDVLSNKNEIENTIENESHKEILNKLFSILTEREKKIIKMTYGIGYFRPYTNEEIAKEIGLTLERIRQLNIEILRKLSDYVKNNKNK